MNERAKLVECLRGEIVGPARPISEPDLISFSAREFHDPVSKRKGPLAWIPPGQTERQEVLYFEREAPHRKYGAGLLHPTTAPPATEDEQAAAAGAADLGFDTEEATEEDTTEEVKNSGDRSLGGDADNTDDFEVTSPDVRHPSTIGISFCALLRDGGELVIRVPESHRFAWQDESSQPFALNGRYESCKRRWLSEHRGSVTSPMWRRLPAVSPNVRILVKQSELASRQVIKKRVPTPEGSSLKLDLEVYPRRVRNRTDTWLITMVLRNTSPSTAGHDRDVILYQAFFDIAVTGGEFCPYPENQRSFDQLDADEQSLSLLYAKSAVWAVGHGCAGGWDVRSDDRPEFIYVDVMPAVELPSMTPDVSADGKSIELSMRALAHLSEDGSGSGWEAIGQLINAYETWISVRRAEIASLPDHLLVVANRHLELCNECLDRIRSGTRLLRENSAVRSAFRLANLAMLLQQIGTKLLARRALTWDAGRNRVVARGDFQSPWQIFSAGAEQSSQIGKWRAFQLAFLVMSLDGLRDGSNSEHDVVDLIWFPTGGGKTEAYLAVTAFYLFHERLISSRDDVPRRDGTNVLMRYTLRMLTTQQFQRAASLICSMEYLRRQPSSHGFGTLGNTRFSLGLWIGRDGSPNNVEAARRSLGEYRRDSGSGNPLVLTECPWCRAEIGRYEGQRPASIPKNKWNQLTVQGIHDHRTEGPLLHCPDPACEYGREHSDSWLPIEVIDQRIYSSPPSLIIATVDKFAMISYRPDAGSIFGRQLIGGQMRQVFRPPGLIIQDELHLISGPLGSMYALYEPVIERLCSYASGDGFVGPKIIASTATIRGADQQSQTLYGRSVTRLFPPPGVSMGDSFFGAYARNPTGRLLNGRMYLGIHASNYGSVLTTQVRTFATALFRPWSFAPDRRDAWWTILAFYNSIRELGGAKTLFDSDIRSRLKFMFNREAFDGSTRRNLRIVEELTSRLSHSEIVAMMDRLSTAYVLPDDKRSLDACLASNIIEVGVDIDRLSLMGIVGQPKTTATYIQVSGRVGRRWWDRPGLILMVYNPSKSRDRSHFEQFYSYHRRLYERVEPTTATPFAVSAIQRGAAGSLLTWARQQSRSDVRQLAAYSSALHYCHDLLAKRCTLVQDPADTERSLAAIKHALAELQNKWQQNPQEWESFPPSTAGEYLMLWPGQYATPLQKRRGIVVPSSMRQVDRSAELTITQAYALAEPASAGPAGGPEPELQSNSEQH
jgi:hypothetical protein